MPKIERQNIIIWRMEQIFNRGKKTIGGLEIRGQLEVGLDAYMMEKWVIAS